jgi:hypothetical protein
MKQLYLQALRQYGTHEAAVSALQAQYPAMVKGMDFNQFQKAGDGLAQAGQSLASGSTSFEAPTSPSLHSGTASGIGNIGAELTSPGTQEHNVFNAIGTYGSVSGLLSGLATSATPALAKIGAAAGPIGMGVAALALFAGENARKKAEAKRKKEISEQNLAIQKRHMNKIEGEKLAVSNKKYLDEISKFNNPYTA